MCLLMVNRKPSVDYKIPLTDAELGISKEERELLDHFVLTSDRCIHVDAYYIVGWGSGVVCSQITTRACLPRESLPYFSFWSEDEREALRRVTPAIIKKLMHECAAGLAEGECAPLAEFVACDDEGMPLLTMWRPGR